MFGAEGTRFDCVLEFPFRIGAIQLTGSLFFSLSISFPHLLPQFQDSHFALDFLECRSWQQYFCAKGNKRAMIR